MDKVRFVLKYLSTLNLAYILVIGLLVKALVDDVSYATFLLTVPVLAYEGYKLFLKSKAPDPVRLDAELRRELEAIKTRLIATTMEKNVSNGPGKRYF